MGAPPSRGIPTARPRTGLRGALSRYAIDPLFHRVAGARWLPTHAMLETRGRRSGLARRTPVVAMLRGDTFWLVAENGRRAGYVRNLEADPRVRVKVRGRWRSGTARVLPDDDPRARLRRTGRPLLGRVVGWFGEDLLTVQIDLAPADSLEPAVPDPKGALT
jgi:deazaflavin-dependent oxidoreductase (nitroreductase family)